MKIFFIGDIYGRSGREAVRKYLPVIKQKYQPDIVVANADNASHGNGPSPPVTKELYGYGIDLLTGGDHIWDQKDALPHLNREPWVLRPLNYPDGTIGRGWHIVKTSTQKTLLVISLLGRVFFDKLSDNPFLSVDKLLEKQPLGNVDAIIIDMHAEATSEKNAMAYFLDGRVSAVLGTHTHIPTADARILPHGTAYITDVGMTGDYDSIIGADKKVPLNYFISGLRFERFSPAEGEGTLCGVLIETHESGLAKSILPIRMGGILNEAA
jgi:2',3'-cyclic-nucleotide 2'-phosphodiesterase